MNGGTHITPRTSTSTSTSTDFVAADVAAEPSSYLGYPLIISNSRARL